MLSPFPQAQPEAIHARAARLLDWWALRSGGVGRPLLLILLAAAIPLTLFAGWAAYVTAQQDRAAARRAATAIVDDVAERVTAELLMKLEVLKTLATSPALDRADLSDFYAQAQRLKAADPTWETLALSEVSGMQVLNLRRPLGTALALTLDHESYERVLRTKEPVIGSIGPAGPISGKRLVTLRVPVIRDGDVRYVLTVALIPDAVSAILRDAGAPEGWTGAIVDARGNFVARTLAEHFELGNPASADVRAAIARAPQGDYVGHTLEGVEVETVYRTLPHTNGWSVHFGLPSEALNAPVRRSVYLLAGGGAASLALAAGLGLLTARDIAQRRKDEDLRSAMVLRNSEERGAVAVEAADLGTWRWDAESDVIIGSERCRRLIDVPAVALDGADRRWTLQDALGAIYPDDRAMVESALRRCVEGNQRLAVEHRAVRQDGSIHWLRATGRSALSGPRGTKIVHGVLADIDAEKRAEAERLDLLRRLAQAQENERRRIACELHDGVGQAVTGLSLGLKGLEKTLERPDAPGGVHEQVRWLQDLTGEIGREIHRAASDLRPTALDDLGLHKAVAALASDWSERFGVAIELQTLGNRERLPAEVETAVYRAVQEALTNVFKHAAARHVSIVLERRAREFRAIVEDDGTGFDGNPSPDREDGKADPPFHLGLSGIRERLALVGGTLMLESKRGTGTTLFMQVPVRPSTRG